MATSFLIPERTQQTFSNLDSQEKRLRTRTDLGRSSPFFQVPLYEWRLGSFSAEAGAGSILQRDRPGPGFRELDLASGELLPVMLHCRRGTFSANFPMKASS